MDQLSFENAKVLVVGDIMLDIYKYGDAFRISPEAPVPIVLISQADNKAGGAANVAVNLRSLKCGTVDLVGYVGIDYAGRELKNILSKCGINPGNLILSTTQTITKTRILANKQHVIRYDDDSSFGTVHHRQTYENVLIQRLRDLSQKESFDIIVISDYAKGTITDKVMGTIKTCFSCPIVCDFKPVNSLLFKDVFCVTPNLNEAKQLAVSFEYKNLPELIVIIKKLLSVEAVIITLSEDGVCLLDQNDKYHLFNAQSIIDKDDPTSKPDVTGAGDTVLSALTACLATGHDFVESVRLGNLAAAVVVGKTGTAVCSIEELRNANLRV